MAGGSIFGGHKTRSSNPDGVSSIGIHICDSLNCPKVILKKGDCGTVEHASKKYGVCICDDGYEANEMKCVKKGKCSDGSDPIIKTYQSGDCCSITNTVKYCPGDPDLPSCTCEASCNDDKSTCTGSYGHTIYKFIHICCTSGNAQCSKFGKGQSSCICVPKDAPETQWVCAEFTCKICATDKVPKCSYNGDGKYACACADSLDKIVCGGRACLVQPEGQVCRCSTSGYNEDACACADSLDKIVCSDYACIVTPTD